MRRIETVLVVVAHPDDETFGCGGSLARWSRAGAKVHVAYFTDGVSARPSTTNTVRRMRHSEKAAEKLGLRSMVRIANWAADNRMDTHPLLLCAQAIEVHMRTVRPTMVVTHSAADLNIDHRVVHEAVLAACRPLPGMPVHTVMACEVLSSTEWGVGTFKPTLFVGLSALDLKAKALAMACYKDEYRPFPHPRSVDAMLAQARLRGSNVGVEAAEAFEVIRLLR